MGVANRITPVSRKRCKAKGSSCASEMVLVSCSGSFLPILDKGEQFPEAI
jgi:hypothetical protein